MQGVLLGTAVALVVSLIVTPWVIDFFRARGVGQLIREEGPAAHFVKHGTPTMGGLVLLAAATLGYVAANVRVGQNGVTMAWTPAGGLVLATAWALGILGMIDDFTKIRHRRSLGLNKRAKIAGQAIVGVALALAALHWIGITPDITWSGSAIPFVPELPRVLFAIWIFLLIAGFSNGVNLTDGLDGLACGSAAMGFFVFTIIGFWQFRNAQIYDQLLPLGPHNGLLDASIAAAALLGACIGFLWWNAAPARIFMGDTGSLALGGALGSLALFTRTQLLLIVIGGLFVIETISVIIQVIAYRGFGGRRVFAMAPLHHHFELRGWAEFTVIVRFWLIAALTAGLGLALFYMDFLASGGIIP